MALLITLQLPSIFKCKGERKLQFFLKMDIPIQRKSEIEQLNISTTFLYLTDTVDLHLDIQTKDLLTKQKKTGLQTNYQTSGDE